MLSHYHCTLSYARTLCLKEGQQITVNPFYQWTSGASTLLALYQDWLAACPEPKKYNTITNGKAHLVDHNQSWCKMPHGSPRWIAGSSIWSIEKSRLCTSKRVRSSRTVNLIRSQKSFREVERRIKISHWWFPLQWQILIERGDENILQVRCFKTHLHRIPLHPQQIERAETYLTMSHSKRLACIGCK